MPPYVDMNYSRAPKSGPFYCNIVSQCFAHGDFWWLMTDSNQQDFAFGSIQCLDFMYKYSYF